MVTTAAERLIYYALETQRLVLKNSAIERLILFDAAGRIVQHHGKPGEWVDVSALKNGFYFWQAMDKNDRQISGRFVKM
jgi:hypothetical protein